MALNGLIEGP